jgi:hypothetical protein
LNLDTIKVSELIGWLACAVGTCNQFIIWSVSCHAA